MVDHLTLEQRHRAMANVKLKNGPLEKAVGSALRRRGLRFRKHIKALPGTPDIVFVEEMVAVFVDGDFWHGYRFPSWQRKLTAFWKNKISENRQRDRRNFAKLRRMGWQVIRVWQHEVKNDVELCAEEIVAIVTHRQAHPKLKSGNT